VLSCTGLKLAMSGAPSGVSTSQPVGENVSVGRERLDKGLPEAEAAVGTQSCPRVGRSAERRFLFVLAHSDAESVSLDLTQRVDAVVLCAGEPAGRDTSRELGLHNGTTTRCRRSISGQPV